LPALQTGADWIWTNMWVDADDSFVYEHFPANPLPDTGDGAPDLNMIILPVWGWIYKQTGDDTYITQGDQIFEGGVNFAWLDQGKQFVENYRWSMDYLEWRISAATLYTISGPSTINAERNVAYTFTPNGWADGIELTPATDGTGTWTPVSATFTEDQPLVFYYRATDFADSPHSLSATNDGGLTDDDAIVVTVNMPADDSGDRQRKYLRPFAPPILPWRRRRKREENQTTTAA
jgi:hypothetical protein